MRPDDGAASRAERHDLAVSRGGVAGRPVQEGHEDEVEADGGRDGLAAARRIAPDRLARIGVEREDDAGVVGEEEAAVGDRGRELDEAAGAERPDDAEGRPEVDPAPDAEPLRIEAVHRPDDSGRRRPRRHRLGGDELDR